MEVEEISANVISDDASALSSLTGGSATEDCLDEMKSHDGQQYFCILRR